MKKRMTALALALAMVATISVFAVTADGDPLYAAASMANDGAAYSEEAAKAAALEIFSGTADAETEVFAAEETTDEEPAEEPAAEPEPTPDAEGTLSFANLRSRMLENYYPLLALQESIDDVESHDYEWRYENLRKRLNEIASGQWAMISNPLYMDPSLYAGMQTMYDTFRDQFDDIKKGKAQKNDEDALWMARTGQSMTIIAGEGLFMQIKALETQDEAITRGLGQLDRTLEEMELRQKLGQVSTMAVEQIKNTRTQTASQQQSLQTGIETALLTLESMVGAELGEPLKLGELPKVTAEQLDAMELEGDLAKAKEANYDLYDAQKQIEDFRKETYKDVIDLFGRNEKIFEVSQVMHALEAMKINYEDKVQTFELNFRTLYAQVKDAAQVLDAKRAALSSQEKSYVASALKYDQGTISANALQDAKDELATAKDNVLSAERELFSKYRSYQWAVEYGIMNGNS